MRIAIVAAISLSATAAFADDTKPPVISEVKSSTKGGTVTVEARITDETGVLSAIVHHRGKGGKVEDSPMVKNDYDDVFKTSFPGSGDTEYWIESSDLLGNGPSMYGSPSRPIVASGKPATGGTTVAQRESTPPPEKKERPPPRERRHREATQPKQEEAQPEQPQQQQQQQEAEAPPPEERKVAKAPTPPVIEHRKPSMQPPEGRDFTVRVKIHSESPVEVAIIQTKQQGATGGPTNTPLTHTEGDGFEAKIASEQAKGTVEYFLLAKNQAGMMARKGDSEDNKTPYMITFKPSASSSTVAASTVPQGQPGPFGFTHNPLFRVLPNKPILVRAQVVPAAPDGQLPDRVAVLFRGNDAQDQIVDMAPDENGGYGGFKVELPPQDEGAVFYQVVACDAGATACGVDTGSKRKWHAAAVAAQPGGAQPLPLDSVSQKAPPSLPE
jgi:hypothetical protein